MKNPIKIALWCLVVGLILVFFGLDPLDMWVWLGALVVLPIVAIRWFMRRANSRPSGDWVLGE